MKRLFTLCLLTLFAKVAPCQSFAPSAAQPGPADRHVARGSAREDAGPEGPKSSAPPAVGAVLDNVHKGMAYADFRSVLLTDGWQPVIELKCKANVVGGAYKELCDRGSDSCKACDEPPELSACSGMLFA
jgi:hypothetical protein